MGLIGWIVLGAIVGWAANLVVGGRDRRPQGCIVSILVGVAGAFLGGWLYQLATGHPQDFGWNFTSFGIALVGAVILLALLSLLRGAGRGGRQ
ncbi:MULTISPECIES: GlsB/YeaQ/YmgE family stress response membrane protein [unclassified Kutzneria]|uniref:GlsB/YeaQ/YmgE family stress response membrane protein n=1 Tax=unclassified Kutzneria TaxID=2621979 RepID=UPI0003EEE17F|nr:GlsB/YeaQ/YmgE family stress response membrane protein [Kutzneria sp. 744]EWM14359.1 transglycosylase [Kutzneria sp. 744]